MDLSGRLLTRPTAASQAPLRDRLTGQQRKGLRPVKGVKGGVKVVLHKLKGEGGSRWGVGVGAEVDVAQGPFSERDQGGG